MRRQGTREQGSREKGIEKPTGWELWFPTLSAEKPERMGHGAVSVDLRDIPYPLVPSFPIPCFLRLALLHLASPDQVAGGFEDFHGGGGAGLKGRLRGEWGGDVGAPLKRETAEDETGAGQMAGAGDNFCRVPAMGLHNLGGVTGVLDGVFGLGFDEDGRFRNALSLCGARHYARFNKLVSRSAAGEDEPRSHAALVLMHGLCDAGQLGGRWVAVGVGWIAEDDDGVEAVELRVARGSEVAREQAP